MSEKLETLDACRRELARLRSEIRDIADDIEFIRTLADNYKDLGWIVKKMRELARD